MATAQGEHMRQSLSTEQWSTEAEIVEIQVIGIGFDDEVVCEATMAIAQPGGGAAAAHESWVLV